MISETKVAIFYLDAFDSVKASDRVQKRIQGCVILAISTYLKTRLCPVNELPSIWQLK